MNCKSEHMEIQGRKIAFRCPAEKSIILKVLQVISAEIFWHSVVSWTHFTKIFLKCANLGVFIFWICGGWKRWKNNEQSYSNLNLRWFNYCISKLGLLIFFVFFKYLQILMPRLIEQGKILESNNCSV